MPQDQAAAAIDNAPDVKHFAALEAMYLSAPINKPLEPTVGVRRGEATVTMAVSEQHHHAAAAVHGSVYFKMLDDAAFFAAASLEAEQMVLTASFTTYLTRPVTHGTLRAEGRVVNQTRSQFIVEAIVFDGQDREIGRGNGVFVRGKIALSQIPGYQLE